ncbi:MAG: glycine--tRNA ligase subunit beta [Nitrospinae bacterium]|nr:glycine--tRNA ligase subunit beta [Nitrospinota bacterium]
MNELLYEIGVEELPSGYIHPAATALKEGVLSRLSGLGVTFGDVSAYATPRRLALSIKDLPDTRPQRTVKHYGPPAKAAYDSNGALTRAGSGFAKSKGVDVGLLKTEKTDKGDYLCVEIQEGGEPLKDILADTLSQVTLSLSFPKSMTWGAGGVSFARPIRWVVAVFGGKPVEMKIGGVNAGAMTTGHRFMSSGQIGVTRREDYLSSLRENFVLADVEERKRTILSQAKAQAEKHGASLVEDDELLETVAYITEWPVPLWGSFDKEFLALPEELLVTTMKHHQKMFAVKGPDGKVTNGFIGVSNTATPNADAIVAGYRRVLRARLSDAKFFFDEDRKKPIEHFNDKLKDAMYQKKLGTMADKAKRVTALAEYIAGVVSPETKATAIRAGQLCKFDLTTQMVFEFPELQGVMGREYARHSGEAEEVCLAIYEHYLPKGAGGELPSTLAGAIVGVADRMDSIVGCFGIGLIPSGAQDPFALRRNALGIIQIVFNKLARPVSLGALIDVAIEGYGGKLDMKPSEIKEKVLEFFAGRLKSLWMQGGAPHDVADAVLASGFDDLADANLKAGAVTELKKRDFFEPLAITFKRVANISGGHVAKAISPELFEKPIEGELFGEIEKAEKEVLPLIVSKQYLKALERISDLRPVVDRFFNDVMVMAEDANVRENRLSLLARLSGLFGKIADFSKIVAG